ncbi:hypothetical protein HDV57DRAFT_11584 [Trichoderma longibrachiatum]
MSSTTSDAEATHHEQPESITNSTHESPTEPDDETSTSARQASQERTTSEGCSVASVCASQETTCQRCLQLGLECLRPLENQRILRAVDENRLGMQAENLDGLTGSCSNVTGNDTTNPQECMYSLQLLYLADVRRKCRFLQIDSVKILSWPVFGGQFGPQAKALDVLPQNHPERRKPSVSDLYQSLSNPDLADELVLNFIDRVHIKNPILDALSLRSRAHLIYSAGIE